MKKITSKQLHALQRFHQKGGGRSEHNESEEEKNQQEQGRLESGNHPQNPSILKKDKVSKNEGKSTKSLDFYSDSAVDPSEESTPREKQPPLLSKLLFSINAIFNLGYFYEFFRAIQLKAIIGSMVSLASTDTSKTPGHVDILITVITLSFYVGLILSVYWLIRYKTRCITLPWKHPPDPDYEAVIAESDVFRDLKAVKKDDLGLLSTLIIDLTHDFFIPIFLILFVNSPSIQITFALMMTCLSGGYYIYYKPFKDKIFGFLKVFNKVVYCLILVVFLVARLTERRITKAQSYYYVGFGVIGLIGFMFLVNFGVMVISLIQSIAEKARKNKVEQKEVWINHKIEDENRPNQREIASKKDESVNSSAILSLKEDQKEDLSLPLPKISIPKLDLIGIIGNHERPKPIRNQAPFNNEPEPEPVVEDLSVQVQKKSKNQQRKKRNGRNRKKDRRKKGRKKDRMQNQIPFYNTTTAQPVNNGSQENHISSWNSSIGPWSRTKSKNKNKKNHSKRRGRPKDGKKGQGIQNNFF